MKILIIGAGGVGRVAVHKCAQLPEVFRSITLASRRRASCEEIAASVTGDILIAQLDADVKRDVEALIVSTGADLVLHVALPYQNLVIMEACRDTGVHYIDTAIYEHPDDPNFWYDSQLVYHDEYMERSITALLGSGFDPGVTNVFCAYAQKHLFDEIHYVDIVDCNGGDNGLPFATNFNPEINLREVTLPGRFWENGELKTFEPMTKFDTFDFPGVGPRKAYMMAHEEIESLVTHLKGIKRMRFWMTFSDDYLEHLRVLQNVGLTRIDPVMFEGSEIIPIRFLKAMLPNPSDLGARTQGQTCIGCIFEGVKNGERTKTFIYNNCDHEEAFAEVGSQAVSYTTGVPAMIGAKLVGTGVWQEPGVYNMEQFDPDPFMDDLNTYGLPWHINELPLPAEFGSESLD